MNHIPGGTGFKGRPDAGYGGERRTGRGMVMVITPTTAQKCKSEKSMNAIRNGEFIVANLSPSYSPRHFIKAKDFSRAT
jgi:hypothetical protein